MAMTKSFDVSNLSRSIQTTIELVGKAVTLIQDYGQSDRVSQLFLPHLEDDAESLWKVLRALGNIRNSGPNTRTLNDREQRLYSDIEAYLDSLQQRLKRRTEGLADGSISPTQIRTTRDLDQLEKRLNDWTTRFQLTYSIISSEILTKSSPSAKRINALRSIFSQLTILDSKPPDLYIPFSDIQLLGGSSRRMCALYQRNPVIAEYMYKPYFPTLTPSEISDIGSEVFELARVLHRSDPDQTQILKCSGYFHDTKARVFGLLYEVPPSLSCYGESMESRVLSLRELLRIVPRFSLSHRLRLACDIAKAVLYVHLAGWVHKSIRPNNILLLEDPSIGPERRFPYALARPYVAGFEHARSVKIQSNRTSDAEWQLNIYRHPKRQFLERNTTYNMSHDVYSLGAVFLELGLWGSYGFVPFEDREDLFKDKTGEQIKETLLGLMRGRCELVAKDKGVAVMMGDSYAALVRFCLEVDELVELPSAEFVEEVWLRLDEMRSALC
ncbi:MAG: hypothetical protein M1840_006241 [Geoglossum simile]|nr:MAG: hypothetical protein M1840_006241 [Geoglossum simile]